MNETNNEIIGVDLYNLALTGGVSMTIKSARSDNEHTPCVMIKKEEPILLESNQNHATIRTDGVCTTLSASMGLGGGIYPYDSSRGSKWKKKRNTNP